MTIQDIALFKAISEKMDYLSQRQRIIAQNIANSDTPGYRPLDLKPVDFKTILKGIEDTSAVTIEASQPGHMGASNELGQVRQQRQRDTYEVAPAGNAVVIEEQMLKSGQNTMDYNLMVNIYQKQINMMRTAIGAN